MKAEVRHAEETRCSHRDDSTGNHNCPQDSGQLFLAVHHPNATKFGEHAQLLDELVGGYVSSSTQIMTLSCHDPKLVDDSVALSWQGLFIVHRGPFDRKNVLCIFQAKRLHLLTGRRIDIRGDTPD